jgi:hypothetical protein
MLRRKKLRCNLYLSFLANASKKIREMGKKYIYPNDIFITEDEKNALEIGHNEIMKGIDDDLSHYEVGIIKSNGGAITLIPKAVLR